MQEIVRPAVILLIITAVAAALLGAVESITAEPIALANEKTQNEAMQAALPAASSFEDVYDASTAAEENKLDGTISLIKEGLDESGATVGYVIVTNPGGFGGSVPTTVGIGMDGVITGISVTTPSETPGLGAKAAEPEFQAQFAGMSGTLAVSKDGGQVQAITAATITSRAVVTGVNEATTWFAENGGAN